MSRLLLGLLLGFAASPIAVAQKGVEATVTLEGQIVCCQNCWAERDRRTTPYGSPVDLQKAAQCIARGDPTLLAVMNAEGATTFYQLEGGTFNRPGKNWLAYIGKRVSITGPTRSKNRRHYIKVDALTLDPSSQDEIATPHGSAVGSQAELTLKDLSGVEQRLSAYRGRVVVLNFWATWCIPCRGEMPDLAAIQNRYAALGVQVIGASVDTTAAQPKVLRFIKETKLNFPVWLGATTADMARLGLGSALPGSVVLDRDGKIVSVITGVIKQAELKKQIEAMLAAAAPAQEQRASAGTEPGEASNVPS